MNTSSQTFARQFGEWASSLKFEEIPASVKEKAKLQILSVLGAIYSASQTRAGKILAGTSKKFFGKGKFPVPGLGKNYSLFGSVYSWAGLSVAQDYDDYLLFGHSGHSAVSVPLLLGAEQDASPQEILTAQIIANEIEGRIGASVVVGPHNGQGWSFIHLAGSALACARLLGLDEDRSAQALAISFYQPTYLLWSGFMGPDSKLLTSALPTTVGVQSAYLAKNRFTGALDIIENPQGFLNHFSYYPLPMMLSGLGKVWTTDTLAYKIYPGCAYIDTTVDAVLEILRRYQEEQGKELEPEQVQEVVVEATILTVEMDHLSKIARGVDELNPVRINFSIPHNVALAIIHKKLTGAELREESLKEQAQKIKELARRVRLVHNLELTLGMLRKMSAPLKLEELLRQLSLARLLRAEQKIRTQYRTRLGIEWREAFQILSREAKPLLNQMEASFKNLLKNWLEPAGKKEGWSLEKTELGKFSMPFSARVSIRLRDGRVYTYQQDLPRAGAGTSIEEQKQLVIDKFLREAGAVLDGKQAEKICQQVLGFENLGSIKPLLEELG